jgi:hypothetical protein
MIAGGQIEVAGFPRELRGIKDGSYWVRRLRIAHSKLIGRSVPRLCEREANILLQVVDDDLAPA